MLLETLDRALQKTLYWHRVAALESAVATTELEVRMMFAGQAYDILMALYMADLSEAAGEDDDDRRVAVIMAAIALALKRRLDRDVLTIKPGLAQALRTALVNSAFAKYGIQGGLDSIRGEQWLLAHGAELVTQINEYTRERMAKLLAESFRKGESIETIATKLMAGFDEMNLARARRIALTETSKAWSYAEMESAYEMERAGYRMVKEWLLGPMHPRYDPCDHNHEQGAVPLRQPFSTGDMAPPQHPNCGCSLITYPDGSAPQPWGSQVIGQTPLMPFGFDQGEQRD
jgi:hypothetical protein